MENNKCRTPLQTLFAAVLLLTLSFKVSAQDGASLFKKNCAVCHTTTDTRLTGPGLKGVFDRVPKAPTAEAWMTAWILDNSKVRKSGDAYGNDLFAKFGNSEMTIFQGQLSEKDIAAILKYVKNPPPPTGPGGQTVSAPGEEVKEVGPVVEPVYLWLGAIILLIILLYALRSVRYAMQNAANKAAGKAETPELSFMNEAKEWMTGHRRVVGVISLILVFGGMKSCWDACFRIGVYYDWKTHKGYKPSQPIKFSHKLHAGDNEIACQYCHSTVEKSRHAGIPTVNICMNCHKGIKEGPQYKGKEIAKIYAAAGWDVDNQKYTGKQNPLKWIKVHTLPDHVYFNHSQHVVVGKIECATCHGNLKEMTVAEQKSPLTMKWCIDCHRNTQVAMEGNAYYDRLHKALKEKYAGRYDVKFTVDKIGGLECGKCHY
jgi:mono/diheme cytochrome c family protein